MFGTPTSGDGFYLEFTTLDAFIAFVTVFKVSQEHQEQQLRAMTERLNNAAARLGAAVRANTPQPTTDDR